jgi:hypothetical protein
MTMAEVGVLTEEQRGLLRVVLNRIVPEREGVPGAGDLGVGATIERGLVDAPAARRLFLDGLLAIELAGGSAGFLALDGEAQDAALRTVEASQPTFFASLVDQTYKGYYTEPRVLAAIGFDGPPQPRGNQMAPFNPELLHIQRKRAPFWRKTS